MREHLMGPWGRRWRLAPGVGALIAVSCDAREPGPSPRALAADEMEQIRGGIYADISFPASNSTQTYDNLRFTASISGASGDATIAVFAGATKVGAQVVTVPSTWDGRTTWPMPGGQTAQFKFASGGDFFDAEGDSTRTNLGLHSSVNVYGIRARNLSAGLNSTSVPDSFMRDRVDAVGAATPTKTANTLDGIYGDCGGTNKTQWRLVDTTSITVSAACSDLGAVAAGCGAPFSCSLENWAQCPALVDCLTTYYIPEAALSNDVYVFNVDGVMCGALGVNILFQPPGQSFRTMVLMNAGLVSNPTNYTGTLAHELGHEFSFGHCDDGNPAATRCEPSDCAVSGPARNLMCTSGQGRTVNAAQCTGYTAGLRWTDRND
jgi:hypothetical protein